jgi:hypothetical protein
MGSAGRNTIVLATSDPARIEKIPFLCVCAMIENISNEKGHRYILTLGEKASMAGKA